MNRYRTVSTTTHNPCKRLLAESSERGKNTQALYLKRPAQKRRSGYQAGGGVRAQAKGLDIA